MPLSRYMKIWPCQDKPGSVYLYSTRKGSLVRVSEELLSAAQSGTLAEKDRATLRRLEMWVDDPQAERAGMAGLVDLNNARANRFKGTVVLTLACNLACPYCFEDRFRGNYAMDDETARLFMEYVERERIGRGHDVELRFYGGEPLMALPRLKEIARRLQRSAADRGTKFSFGMVTNGTLLTRAVAEDLVPIGFTKAQVTLDGPPEIHDRQRPFVSGAGSFAAIVANMREVCGLIEVHPGGNFTRDNYREFPRMLDDLLAAGIDPHRLGPVQFAPIIPKSGQRTGHDAGCVGSFEPWFAEATLFLREETVRRGFAVTKPAMGICMIELESDLVINYDGSLFKCPALMGWPEYSIGTLAEGTKDYRQSHNLALWHNDTCLDCAYLPLCFGGCRLVPLHNRGAMDEPDCRKGFFDAALEKMVVPASP